MGKPVVGSKNNITYTEVHAGILGIVIGVLAGYVSELGFHSMAVGVAIVFIMISLGVGIRGDVPIAQRTIRREPWYALTAFLLGGAIGTLI
ncbi:hypothetical protein [Haladaptatus caseinilyticus]|uniref:hypothetical protein n=1 Tax=Haladaptatus caseinilyticus TaxID=2993314 RepID=UPI00224A9305|nr:hypothetical protein [Haladaptatus caseinilyticus]